MRNQLERKLIKVTDRVYCAFGYARSNVLFVITTAGVVAIDSTESTEAAQEILDDFRKLCALPITHLIYTHFHGDHIRGARVLYTPSQTTIIAQRLLPWEISRGRLLLPYKERITAIQFGLPLRPRARREQLPLRNTQPARHSTQRSTFIRPLRKDGYVPPQITFDDRYCFEEGGVSFELLHMPGETHDQLVVWLPKERTLFSADLFYNSFPMLSNPMKPDRPVLDWADSLARMRALDPAVLVPSHTQPLYGESNIQAVLGNYEKAIRHVHDETLKAINRGQPLDHILQQVALPSDLAQLPYLQQGYGRVRWSIVGIHRYYSGWYDLNPAHLNRGLSSALHRAILDASGGSEPLVQRARKALIAGEDQLALELVDIVLSARPADHAARDIRTRALRKLYEGSTNGVERNIYQRALHGANRPFPP